MIGCFVGIVVLSLSKSGVVGDANKVGGEKDQKQVTSAEFYFGLGSIFITSLGYSMIAVLTRRMQNLHFSLI